MKTADPTAVRLTSFVPQETIDRLSPKQQAFLWLQVKEAFYGGAAGGGKSEGLLIGGAQYVDVPGYAAILFRRTYTDLSLPGALMDRSHEWWDNDPEMTWHDKEKTWEFPSGATITFGYLKNWRDKFRYRSSEFQYIAFDELTEFPKDDYLFLFSRLRRPKNGPLSLVPLRMRSASNPGGIGHVWVKERMVDNRSPKRVFIPATLWDNDNIDQESYLEALQELDEQTYKQMAEGDWTVRPAGDWFFDHAQLEAVFDLGRKYDKALSLDKLEPAGGVVDLAIDWGESTQAYTVIQLEGGGLYIPPSEVVCDGIEPGESSRRMVVRATGFGWPVRSARYDAAGVQSMRTFVATVRPLLPRLKTVKVPFGNKMANDSKSYKSETCKYLQRLVERTGKGERTQVLAISPENHELCRQLPELKREREGLGAWLKEDDQHGPDALVAGAAPVAKRFRKVAKPR